MNIEVIERNVEIKRKMNTKGHPKQKENIGRKRKIRRKYLRGER